MKNKFENKNIEYLIFRSLNIRNFEISVVLHLVRSNADPHPGKKYPKKTLWPF